MVRSMPRRTLMAVATMGASAVADAVRAARAAGMTALVLAAVADFAVLRPDPATGLRAHRDLPTRGTPG